MTEPALCDAKKLLFFLFFLFFSVFFGTFCKIGESEVINSLSTAKAILTPVKNSENLHKSPLWCNFFGTNVLYKVTYLCKYYAEMKRKGKGGCAPKSPALTRLRFGGTPPLFPTVTHSVKKELTYWVKYAIMKAADGNGNHQPKGMLSGLVSSKAFCTNAIIAYKRGFVKMNQTKSWVRLPLAALQDEQLTKSDVVVLAVMIDILDNKTSSEISITRLMSCTGYSRRTISYALKRLTECGYIASERTGRASRFAIKADILPPKKRNAQKQKQPESESDLDEYEIFLNNF